MADVVTIQEQATTNLDEKKLHRIQIGGVWHVLIKIGYYRGWPEWHWIKEDEYLRSRDK